MDNNDFKKKYAADHTGAFAEAFFIANLLFVGVFYIVLWGLYFVSYKNASSVSRNHLKQVLFASSLTTLIVVLINVFIVTTASYASLTALLSAEIYLMVIVPIFMVLGVFGFTRAVNEKDFVFPVIGKILKIKPENT